MVAFTPSISYDHVVGKLTALRSRHDQASRLMSALLQSLGVVDDGSVPLATM